MYLFTLQKDNIQIFDSDIMGTSANKEKVWLPGLHCNELPLASFNNNLKEAFAAFISEITNNYLIWDIF